PNNARAVLALIPILRTDYPVSPSRPVRSGLRGIRPRDPGLDTGQSGSCGCAPCPRRTHRHHYFFLPPAGLRSGACVRTVPASFFAAVVEDFCWRTLPARLDSSLEDFSFLLIA